MKTEESVKEVKKKISKLGPMLPGKIKAQWTQCKVKGCRCMDDVNPQKHGPYNQLSFTFAGKSSTMNIKDCDLKKAQEYIENFKMFKELSKQLVQAGIADIRRDGFKK